MRRTVAFDRYARNYDLVLDKALALSGENRDYFARGRMAWLARCLRAMGCQSQSLLDYGCGTGASAPPAFELLGIRSFIGVDISADCLSVAARDYGRQAVRFALLDDYVPRGDIDLAFCNGVFHHIPPDHRAAAAGVVYRSLRPGGLFAFWENNPWNPGTRMVMSRCPFDGDAVPISLPHAMRLLREAHFEVLRTDFLFLFPRLLRCLRWIEPALAQFPLGAQYQALCRRP